MLVLGDLTATATLVLAAITLGLVIATIALVLVTRSATAQARADARVELDLLQRQFGAEHRPLLVDVLTAAPVPPDMPMFAVTDPTTPPKTAIQLPGMVAPLRFDPRRVFGHIEGGRVFVSVPLRNVGRGLAVIDGSEIEIEGPGVGQLQYRTIMRYHVPVNETTRVDLATGYKLGEPIEKGTVWLLTVPYTDFAGEQRTVAKLQLVLRGDEAATGPWYVERVDQG
jgi:hypothetical protein